jgi:hypothetical protein
MRRESFADEESAFKWVHEIEARLRRIAEGDYRTYDWRLALHEIREELKLKKRLLSES